jgi:hypothetical protein
MVKEAVLASFKVNYSCTSLERLAKTTTIYLATWQKSEASTSRMQSKSLLYHTLARPQTTFFFGGMGSGGGHLLIKRPQWARKPKCEYNSDGWDREGDGK